MSIQYPQWACARCMDTKFIWIPSLDGDSVDKTPCPIPIHNESAEDAA